MYQDKKNRSDKYHQKKRLQWKHDKFQKKSFSQEESNLIESIERMSVSQLYNFIEKKIGKGELTHSYKKFDKVVETNDKMLPKICTAIKKRMDKFHGQFKNQQKQNLGKFVRKHTGKSISEQDMKEIFEREKFQPFKLKSDQLIHVSYEWEKHIDPKIFLITVTVYEPKQQFSNLKKKFYLKGLNDKIFQDLQFKRIQKDGLKFLEDYMQDLKRVENAINQQ